MEIQEKIKQNLESDEVTKDKGITVEKEVKGFFRKTHYITLKGSVDSRETKNKANQIATHETRDDYILKNQLKVVS
ncbi:MAG: hypothetical protein ACLFR1_15810 [Spirochaetia bacterium]